MSAPDDARFRVLVVDDESDIVTELAFYLSRKGIEVLCGESGETALAFLGQRDSETLTHMIVDLRMPGMDGFELIRRIDRERRRRRDERLRVSRIERDAASARLGRRRLRRRN